MGRELRCSKRSRPTVSNRSPTTTGTVVLRNCPFHQLAREHTELICGMNHCMLGAVVEVLDDAGLAARLEPEEGFCCVRLHPVR